MKADEKSILVSTNPLSLLGAAFLVCAAAWLCVYLYKDTNDFQKSFKLFVPVAAVLDCIFIFACHLDIILTIGLDLCGIAVLALVSNYYFYH